jgi:broad specificity phosphatase PhoE
MAVMKLLLIRHAQSLGNVEGRMEGWTSTGLSFTGKQQSVRLGQRLAKAGWQPTRIYCSPLQRATETLSEVLRGFEAERQASSPSSGLESIIRLREDLKEYHNGILAGLTWSEAKIRYPNLCQDLEQSLDWRPIPQAETLRGGRQRAHRFLVELLTHHQNDDQIWVISHHWLMQQLIAALMGCDRTWGFAIAHTGLFEFWLDLSRWHQPGENRLNTELWQLKRFNDCEHCNS